MLFRSKRIPQKVIGIFSGDRQPVITDSPAIETALALPSKKQGLIVLPSTDNDEEVKRRIQESFSDEVKVTPRDDGSGIIVPVFREREGDEYLYIMVPMGN